VRPGLGDEHREGGQYLLLDSLAILSGEFQFLQRVAQAGPDPDRIEQRVLVVPGPNQRLTRHSDQAVVKPQGKGSGELARHD
jgi:hypothetical protein